MNRLIQGKVWGILVLSMTLFISSTGFAADNYIGKISRIDGEVRLKSDSRIQSGKWLRVMKPGVRVFDGDEIRTLVGSAEITFNDGGLLKVRENTHFEIKERETTSSFFSFASKDETNRNIKIFSGGLWAKIVPNKGKWTSFESKSAVAAISGTTISLIVDQSGSMQFACDEGFVQIASPDGGVILKMESGKEVKINSYPGGKTEIISLKGDLEITSGDVRLALTGKGAVIVGTSDGKATIEVPAASKGLLDLFASGSLVKLKPGDAVSYDKNSGLFEVIQGTVAVTTKDGKTTGLSKGERLSLKQEPEKGLDEKSEKGAEEASVALADQDVDEGPEDLELVDPIPVETDLPPSQSNP